MKRVFHFIVNQRIWFVVFWLALVILSLILFPMNTINYDSTAYLPDDMKTKQSLAIMEAEFGLNGQALIMIDEVSDISEALRYKVALKSFDGILEIMWLDTFVQEDQLLALEDAAFDVGIRIGEVDIPGLNQFYTDKKVLFQVVFIEGDASDITMEAITQMRDYLTLIQKPFAMSGTAVSSFYTRTLTEAESIQISFYIVPIILILLIVFTSSWLEPILFLLVVGIAVLVNMGTNAFYPNVSFLTNSTAMLLQLAIAMDYSIFLLHRYSEEKSSFPLVTDAMKSALTKSFIPIASSMLTTAASFIALMFMRYTIGLDMALVMIKGILLSFLCAFTLMPALTIYFSKWIDQTKHRVFFPKMEGLSKQIFKLRYVVLAITLILLIPSYNAQRNNAFIYGDSAISASVGTIPYEERQAIETTFGKRNLIVVLIPADSVYEKQMISDITTGLAQQGITASVQSYATLTDIDSYVGDVPQALQDFVASIVPEEWIATQIPDEFKSQLVSDNYARLIITLDTDTESERAFSAVNIISSTVPRYFSNPNSYHIIGSSSSIKEIKEIVEADFKLVNLISIGLVLLILLITFKSILIPLILVVCIELSVWINMSIPFLTGKPIIFIGYLIVGAVQLGATIDYGILLTQNYLDLRVTNNKKEALRLAINQSLHSILTSVLILCFSGYALFFASSIEGVAVLGELIGRGALLSGFFVVFILPAMLFFLDHFIQKTTFGLHFYGKRENNH